MQLTEQINIRIERELKKDVEDIFNNLGIRTTEAIRMFLQQVRITKSIPFELKLYNQKTIDAINEIENGGGIKVTNAEFDKMLGL
jgi:DNA-damage-inducible protein J